MNINQVMLTTADTVKSITPIGDNVNGKMLGFAIREAQEIQLKQIIGQAMLLKLKDLVGLGTIEDEENTKYVELLNIAQFFLAYTALTEVMIPLAYKIDNAGVIVTTDENIENVSYTDLCSIRDYYARKVDYYRLQLQQYILKNKSNLPEISEKQCNEISAVLYSSASCPIWLGGARGKKNI